MRSGLRLLFLGLPPLFVIAAAELGLRAAGMRVPRYAGQIEHCDYWIPYDEPGRPAGFARAFPRPYRFFPERPPLFLRDKPANGFRVFVVGESSVYGWPYDVGGFTDWIRVRLRAMLRGRAVEVVNAGNPGWPAFDTRTLLDECLEHRPDLLVWMAGDSEFVPQNVYRLREEVESPRLARVRDALYDSRLLRVLSYASPSLSNQRLFLGDHSAKDELPCYGVELDLLKQRYREALAGAARDAKAAGVPIVLCTLPRNAREKAPLGSFFSERLRNDRALHAEWDRLYGEGLARLDAKNGAGALASLEAARAIDESPAKLHFAIGRAHAMAGDEPHAREAFLRAVELDACPVRAQQWIDTTIHEVAREEAVPLVDLRATFDAASKAGLAGGELLIDNVHPNLAGHERISGEILNAIERDVGVRLDRAGDPDPTRVRAELSLDRYNAYLRDRGLCLAGIDAALRSGKADDPWRRARTAGSSALTQIPDDWEVVASVGVLDAVGGDPTAARLRILKAMSFDGFVRTSYLARYAVDERFRKVLDGVRVDVASVEAALSPAERLVVENRVARLRTR